MSYTNRGNTDKNKLPCFTVGQEYKCIVDGYVAKSLADLMAAPDVKEADPQMVENEKLWKGGGSQSDDWLEAELNRIASKGKKV